MLNRMEHKGELPEEIINLIKESQSVILASVKNLPSKQFQLIKKKLRKDVVIKVIKKRIINRAYKKR